MKHNFPRLFSASILILTFLLFVPAGLVYAADLLSISPSTILNNVPNTITVTGSGFDNTAVVLLDGSALSTTYVDAQTLTATVPVGISAGSYTITVTMTGTTVNGFAVLTVNAPPPTSTPAVAPFSRPQFVVHSSKAIGKVQTGKEFTLKVDVENLGQATAYSAQAVFSSADLVPTKTGGIYSIGTVKFDDEREFEQTFYVQGQFTGQSIITIDMTITYYDEKGTSYSDKFTLSVSATGAAVTGGSGSYATATPTGVKAAQLVITNYTTSIDPLQPGEQFALKLKLQNVGNVKAQRITMIVGGGSSGGGGGTPQPGGVSGGSGDFANFAPVGASNVQSLGDLGAGDETQADQSLIVNVNTSPGAYPMKITFSYINDQGEVINDEQVITLLVYSLPAVDVSFYRPPDPFFVDQPGPLPIQVVNTGKRLAVLGNIKLSAKTGQIDSGTSLIGSLDAGGYFTLDSIYTPEQSGAQSLDVVIEYVDDFNQSRTITKQLEIEVQEAFIEPTLDPSMEGGGGGEAIIEEESTLHKIFRFVKGLFGLDSAWPVWQAPGGGGGDFQESAPVVVPAGKG